jgi:hypothetical protein
MALLDDISSARQPLQERANSLADNLRQQGYSYENAQTSDSWDGRWFGADKERLRQLDLLSAAVKDPSWTQNLDNVVDTRRKSGFAQANYAHRGAEDQRSTAAAKGGTAGGSWDAVVEAQNAQEMARIKSTVTQQVNELKAAGIQNLEEMGRQLLDKALAGGNETEAMGLSGQGAAGARGADAMINRNNEDYRGLLAGTLTNFVNNTVAPGISMGFDSAGRWNNQQRENYTDARDSGAYQGNFKDWEAANGGSRSWWGF